VCVSFNGRNYAGVAEAQFHKMKLQIAPSEIHHVLLFLSNCAGRRAREVSIHFQMKCVYASKHTPFYCLCSVCVHVYIYIDVPSE
jgi:hypothetical protein